MIFQIKYYNIIPSWVLEIIIHIYSTMAWRLQEGIFNQRLNRRITKVPYIHFSLNDHSSTWDIDIIHLGREDERKKLDQMVNAVAAQSYDNIYQQLKDLQQQKLKESLEQTEQLKTKLHPPVELISYCDQVNHETSFTINWSIPWNRKSQLCWTVWRAKRWVSALIPLIASPPVLQLPCRGWIPRRLNWLRFRGDRLSSLVKGNNYTNFRWNQSVTHVRLSSAVITSSPT